MRRHVYADLCGSDAFGQATAYEFEATYGAHRIPRLMLVGDGEPWIRSLRDDWLTTARYQLDWWHLGAMVRDFRRADPGAFPRLRRRAFRRPLRLARDRRAGRCRGDPEEAGRLAEYLEANADALHTFTRMGPGHWLHGSGPAEKHIELTVNRRFKRRGMRWSRRSARCLLAIRLKVIAAQ